MRVRIHWRHHSPQLADGLLQVALVQIRDGPVEDCFLVVRVDVLEHLCEQFDGLVVVLRLDLLSTACHKVSGLVLERFDVCHQLGQGIAGVWDDLDLLGAISILLVLHLLELPAVLVVGLIVLEVARQTCQVLLALSNQIVVLRPFQTVGVGVILILPLVVSAVLYILMGCCLSALVK